MTNIDDAGSVMKLLLPLPLLLLLAKGEKGALHERVSPEAPTRPLDRDLFISPLSVLQSNQANRESHVGFSGGRTGNAIHVIKYDAARTT